MQRTSSRGDFSRHQLPPSWLPSPGQATGVTCWDRNWERGGLRERACCLLGSGAAVSSVQTGQSPDSWWAAAAPNALLRKTAKQVCSIVLSQRAAAGVGGCDSRSLCFLTYLLTLTLQASALTEACDQGSNGNPLYCMVWFSRLMTWVPPFLFCIYLHMSSVLIFCLERLQNSWLALLPWIHKLQR